MSIWAIDKFSDEANERRRLLIDKEIDGTISLEECKELADLQLQMLAYRKLAAPLPIEEVRNLLKELTKQASDDGNQNT